MPTTIDSMTGIVITSPFFDTPSSLELFPTHPNVLKDPNARQKNRVALLYGTNGSGKSTIAQGFREYSESTTPRAVDLGLSVGAAVIKMSPGMKKEKIFVFDEEYISRNIKVQGCGLGTIVLFGKRIELEKRLENLERQISQTQVDIDSKNELIKQYNSVDNVIAPEYWQNLIIRKLQSAGGWAETSGIRIKKKQIKARVTGAEVDRLGRLSPRKDEAATRAEFNELFGVFDSIDASASSVDSQIQTIEFPERIIEETKRLLGKVPQKPTLTLREQELLQTLGIEVLSSARGFLTAKSNTICPTCLQPISEDHRTASLQQIENILNREVEEYRNELKKLILPEIQADSYQNYGRLDSELLGNAIIQISSVNSLICNHNRAVQSKIADPLSLAQYSNPADLMDSYKQLNDILLKLENKRVSFNEVISNRRTAESELLKLNDEIAHYAIATEYQSLQSQRAARQAAKEELDRLVQAKKNLVSEQQRLDAKRKNLKIAVDQINKSLSYIFYSDSH